MSRAISIFLAVGGGKQQEEMPKAQGQKKLNRKDAKDAKKTEERINNSSFLSSLRPLRLCG
jgi:hypothetical protein